MPQVGPARPLVCTQGDAMLDVILAIISIGLGGGADSDAGQADTAIASSLVAEEQTPTGKFTTATEIKPIISANKGNWVAVREWDGQDLIYVTHLWSWRCGMAQIEVSVNGAAAEVWPLPPCHMEYAQPNAILDTDGLPYVAFDLKSVETVAVTVTYDDLTAESAEFARSAILIP